LLSVKTFNRAYSIEVGPPTVTSDGAKRASCINLTISPEMARTASIHKSFCAKDPTYVDQAAMAVEDWAVEDWAVEDWPVED